MSAALKLYSFAPFDRAARVRWTALELGLSLEEVALSYGGGDHKEPAYRAMNPFCHVPVVQMPEHCMYESVAICQYLAEKHPQSGLVPALDSPLRASWLSWLFFCASDLDAQGFHVFNYAMLRPDAAKREAALRLMTPALDVLEAHLAQHEYLVGDSFSLPDILLGHALVLLSLSKALEPYAQLRRYRDVLAQRPAAQASGLFAILQRA
ncbi:glutathione S-transferase [Tahibacter aquaticus]|uniref:Glutathione S-transferase n=1 Tax=Tahibacter aquaticus TaxID=520092 RepID=A0A4R6ZAL7_9GAMM|nr:glutathione S-transferase family protein [Tahibacter aquaticus]TDR48882.1 glutathione S-transferase [Tahibacter aquaticus]